MEISDLLLNEDTARVKVIQYDRLVMFSTSLAHMMGGFLGSTYPYPYNSVNKEPSFGRFSLNMGALSRNRRRISKMGGFPPKFIIRFV